MKVHRRKFLHFAAATTVALPALPALPRMARAEAYPSRPVRIVVGFPPGAATDIIARLVAEGLSQRLGQQFIVDNRPGAGSNIGAETAIKAPPDGYTLLAMTVTNAVNATLYALPNDA
jgi:tripartite-type tricarboxylate transporter receptor subunit TctC